MKLYYSPGACSLAVHVALREAGLAFELEKVNLGTKQTSSGADLRASNWKGQVPTLVLDDGEVVTEAQVVLQVVADAAPEKNLIPKAGTRERVRAQEWLSTVSTEIHKGFSPLWSRQLDDAAKAPFKTMLWSKLGDLSKRMEGRDFAYGDSFTVVDAYLFAVLRWAQYFGGLGEFPALDAYVARMAARPSVVAAMEAEGILKK
jgi:glutathione S-transferase